MSRAKGDSGLDGFVNVCKSSGPTSHDVVGAARRILGTRRVGHAGTLDPLAEGVLPLALGRATRLVELLAESDKEYFAEAELGVRTSTDDAAGQVLTRVEVPDLSPADLDAALARLVGEVEQRPPAYSALKVAGRRAYDLARAGHPVRLAARPVTIYSIERRAWQRPVLSFRVRCSKGTYIRSLARDLGDYLGVGASLRRLVRTRVGLFRLAEALSLDQLSARGAAAVLPPDVLSLGQPAVVLGPPEFDHLRHGRRWPATGDAADVRGYSLEGRLAGLLERNGALWQPRVSFVDGETWTASSNGRT